MTQCPIHETPLNGDGLCFYCSHPEEKPPRKQVVQTTYSTSLATKCFYRERDVHCDNGLLYSSVIEKGYYKPVLLEGTGVYCPACEGKGMIPTAKGRELLAFLAKFGGSQLRDIMVELFNELG